MKKYTKTIVAMVIILMVSVIGFGKAFGYGGGGGSVYWGVGGYVPTVVTPVVTTAPVGQVLGVSTFSYNSNLSQGMSGSDVTELQTRLTAEGVYSGPITGYFGPLTLAAVKKHQANNNLPQTGFVGPMTRTVLNNSVATPNVASVLSSGSSLTNMTLKQFVQLLIQTGVIPADKLEAAKKLVQ